MQTKTKLLYKTVLLIVLIIGTVGCRSNGGPWYDIRSYSLYNPLRLEDHGRKDAPAVADNNTITKPHIDSRVDIKKPDGGYNNPNRELLTRDTNGVNSNQNYPQENPIQRTGFHQQIIPNPNSYNGTTPSYDNGLGTATPPVTYGYETASSQPSGYSQPHNFVPQPVGAKNDMLGSPNPSSIAPAGFPITSTYPPNGSYSNPQDHGNVNAPVSGPFANPIGQPNYNPQPVNHGIDANYDKTSVATPYSGQPNPIPNSGQYPNPNPAGVIPYSTSTPTNSDGAYMTTPSIYK
ncbi:MAG: hypothetical protein LBC74_00060 [Planctomycetaceae bacterium]|jgi:hypothetical protein|nr:hypothetical protein [Planctomycetaceae bacterium]